MSSGLKIHKRCKKWDIKNHASVRYKERVSDTRRNIDRRDIERTIRRALSELNDEDIIRQNRSTFYRVYFTLNEKRLGPFYLVADSYEESRIKTLLGEEEYFNTIAKLTNGNHNPS